MVQWLVEDRDLSSLALDRSSFEKYKNVATNLKKLLD